MARKQASPVTKPANVEAKIRAAKAMELRKAGKTFAQIAQELGYNHTSSAHDAVMRALKDTLREPADELRTLELERLDVLWQSHYAAAQTGDVQALAACMKVMERRARLIGLDAPVKQDLTATVETRELPAKIDDFV